MTSRAGFALMELLAAIAVLVVLAIVAGASIEAGARAEAITRNRAIATQFATHLGQMRAAWQMIGTGQPIEDLSGLGDGTADLNRGGFVVGRSAGPRDDVVSVVQCAEIMSILAPAVRVTTGAAGGDYQALADGVGGCRYLRLARAGGTLPAGGACPLEFRYVPVPGAASVSTACEETPGPFYLYREADG